MAKPDDVCSKPIDLDDNINDAICTLKDTMTLLHDSRVRQVDDSTTVSEYNMFVDMKELLVMAKTSPTAQQCLAASECFEKAWKLFEGPDIVEPYQSVEGVHLYAEGLYHENTMAAIFPWNTVSLLAFLEKHISTNPNDYAARYGRFRIHWTDTLISDEEKIRELQILINDMENDAESAQKDLNKKIHYVACLHAASMFTSTDQPQRAIAMFHKCLDIEPEDPTSVLGLATNKEVLAGNECSIDPKTKQPIYSEEGSKLTREVIELFEKYLSIAPDCSKKYPEALYDLATVYLREGHVRKYLVCYERAQVAEERALPYTRSVGIRSKRTTGMYKMMRPRVCYNLNCTERVGVLVKRCAACLEAVYCGKNCQAEHRQAHKKKCKIAHKARMAAAAAAASQGPADGPCCHAGCHH